MKLRLLTASKTEILLTGCTRWLDVNSAWDESDSFVSVRGKISHDAIEKYINRLQDTKFLEGVLENAERQVLQSGPELLRAEQGAGRDATGGAGSGGNDDRGCDPGSASSGGVSSDADPGGDAKTEPVGFTAQCVRGVQNFLQDYSFTEKSLDTEISFAYGKSGNASPGGSDVVVPGATGEPVRIGAVIGRNRDYSGVDPDDRIAGTVDCQIRERSKLTIIDWKTGRGERAGGQLRSLAGMASGGYSDSDVYRILSVEVGPGAEKRNGGAGTFYRVPIDYQGPIKEAREYIEDLYQRIISAETSGLRTVPGSHCKSLYCPHYKHCLRISE